MVRDPEELDKVLVLIYEASKVLDTEALDHDVKPVTDNVPESTMLVPM